MNVLLWQTTYYIPKISENKDVNFLILAPLYTALTVQVYLSNEWNELDEVDELNEIDEVDEVESAWIVSECSISFSKCEVLHSFTRVKQFTEVVREWTTHH